MSKTLKQHVYELHEEGKPMSEIASVLAMDERDVRDLIVKAWAEEKKKHKDSKRLLDW